MPLAAPSLDPFDGFVLRNTGHSLVTQGVAQPLFQGNIDALVPQVATLLHRLAQPVPGHPQAPARLVGGLPFRRDAACHLFQPARQWSDAEADACLAPATPSPPIAPTTRPDGQWQFQAQPSRAAYAQAVAQAVQHLKEGLQNPVGKRGPLWRMQRAADFDGNSGAIAVKSQQSDAPPERIRAATRVLQTFLNAPSAPENALRKVVLARSLRAESSRPIELLPLLRRLLLDASSTTYLLPLPRLADAAPAHLIGASPELLLARHGRQITSHPLAGSVRRDSDARTDAIQVQAMQDSAKEQHEHRLVVEAIADLLAPLCRHLQVPRHPGLHATASMWHLGTRIEGELRDPDALDTSSSLALAALLHPTPAVCGTPRDAAYRLIEELEPVPRGFYAGAVGWCDASGDGAWYVAIRCAQIQGHTARLFAGAGIVADSLPAQEAAETRAKFHAMLHSLDLQPHLTALEHEGDL